jgi:hypothetical protein
MLLSLLFGCAVGEGAKNAGIDTAALWPAEDGRFQVYRHLTADAYAASDATTALDEDDLLFSSYGTGGCADGSGWRVELRAGGAWESATAEGALLVDDAGGLALCGWEDASGASEPYDPPVVLWSDGTKLSDGDTVASGDWSVTARREQDLPTYLGIFPNVVAFELDGDGALGGWTLHFATDAGIVLMENDAYTADLVYTR